MSAFLPATADTVLTDREMELCLGHYTSDKPAKAWIAEGDSAPRLVWDAHDELARYSDALTGTSAAASSSAPLPSSNPRWRDQFLQLHRSRTAETAQRRTGAPSASKKAKAETEYVLISEDEGEEQEAKEKFSARPSQKPERSATRREQLAAVAPRNDTTVSPSPRRSGGTSASQRSQRQSTGSSVVVMSQPAKKAADADAEKSRRGHSATSTSASRWREQADGDEVGQKRQRSMEEFMYRGA
ncbi:unspecified product [Leptomonas pyrrhocoris]|uniref:Unspecified product n=1 Tax=Leptomonas pyrrhocoris TaxID=157538 RepID=A0A0M9G1Q3_LEPPY|nr:unspecified product [Leptomonas pyrrhocoris]XP_015658829.1 unspecified product [Leptomonas pyrrhocoris]XP_015658830.1 unspecified product [Leptomonas pyrrhocoris]KPA80389.1 unspecified product [Leptomonas pyrrhocoris]KPA80390.1 unspecified product [Leptomonas pyrrhocoris]KPA80391.1 unspecified product [Leptomonas pyrrhocoris]|eukprot:XP_015658828.1 unspecified product [Leptomonas pyrrhocoris]